MTIEDDNPFGEVFAIPSPIDYPRVTKLCTKAESWAEISWASGQHFRGVIVFSLSSFSFPHHVHHVHAIILIYLLILSWVVLIFSFHRGLASN